MNKVIGGEFAIDLSELIQYKNNNNLQLERYDFATGRGALKAVLDDINNLIGRKGNILLPDYLCSSITETVIAADWDYSFYHINQDFTVDYDLLDVTSIDAILIIDYFGLPDIGREINNIRSINNDICIILDMVQAYYESMNDFGADYTFVSLRKWFPCADGAYAHRRDGSVIANSIQKTNTFYKYKQAGNALKWTSQEYSDIALKLLDDGEGMIADEYMYKASIDASYIIDSLDLEEVAEIRKQNGRFLHEKLESLGIKHLFSGDKVPLFVPITLDDRDSVRKIMFNNSIFTPVHWPRKSKVISGNNVLYDTQLSLICDQRYNLDDMNKQIEILTSALKWK